jgi:diguanylate cyclase (GGDEF)-like protein
MIVVPLAFREEVVGVLKVMSAKTDHFQEESINILGLISELIAAAMFSALKNEESEVFHKATHDFLTGVSNRSLFYDRLRQRLSQAKRKSETFGIIMMDMDGLKGINDNYGHRTGDAAIKEVALRIKDSLRESDTVSRLGGDEFGVIAVDGGDCNNLSMLIQRIYSEISKPFVFEGHKLELKISAGYSLFSKDGSELEALIEKADQSMYEAKRIRKGLAVS